MARDNLGSVLRMGLSLMYREQRYTDIIIEVKSRKFYCHKVILASVSAFFHSMFTSNMKEASQNSVHLRDMKPETFAQFLTYVYENKDTITEGSVEDLFVLSSMLQVDTLQKHCEEYMYDKIDKQNCLGIWQLAKLHSSSFLEEKSFKFIVQNFPEIALSEDIKKLTADDIVQLISHNDLNVSNEEDVCRCALHWFGNDDTKREKLPFVMKHLRLSQVSLGFIFNEIDTIPQVHESPDCIEIIRRSIKYHSLLARRQDSNDVADCFRANSNFEHYFVVLGQRTKANEESTLEFFAYNQKKDKWFYIDKIPQGVGDEFATCCYGDNIMVTGGTEETDICLSFSNKKGKWNKRSSLKKGRYRHSMVCVGDSFFVLGGYNFGTLSSIEEYSVFDNEWTNVGELVFPVDAAAAAVLGSNIYLFGGWLGFAEDTAVIQEFNTMTYTCTKLSNLPVPTKFARALTVKNHIEVVCSDGKILFFSPSYGTKMVTQLPNFYRRNFGILRIKDTMHILGGVDPGFTDTHSSKDDYWQQCFSLKDPDKEVVNKIKLPTKLEIHGCFFLPLSKAQLNGGASEQIEFDQ